MVTGTFGTGNTIDTEITGNGARMFFNPRKATFRAGFAEGTRWNDALIGDYSFAVNRRSQASGFASVSLGYDSEATGDFSFVAGNNSAATGDHSFAFGRNSYTNSSEYSVVFGDSANSYDNFSWAIGESTDSYGVHSFAKGFNVISKSYGETVFGLNNTDYTANSTTTFNDFDRLFVIGNGINSTNLSNALTIFKDGRMNINDAYTMPTTDGTNGQVMQTNGAGIVSWATPSTGTDDQNLITPTLVGTTLNLNIENGTGTSIDLAPLQDGTGTDNQTLTLAGNNLSISSGNSVNLSSLNTDDQNLVTPTLVGTTLNLNIENGTGTSIDLAPLQDGIGADNQTLTLAGNNLSISGGNSINLSSLNTDDQNLVTPTLVGTTLNLNIENGTGTSIDLAPLQDGIGTDNQTLTLAGNNLSISGGNSVNLSSLNTDDQNLITPTLIGTTLNLNIENGTGTSIDLAPLQDGTGTDDQTIDNFSLSGTTLRLSLENDGQPLQTVNLASINTDDQNLTTPNLVGTTLNLGIENGTGTSIDLAPLQDGTGTDDQTIDNFSLSGTTLRLSLENDGQPLQTVNLASLLGTDDQNLTTPTLVGTTLNLNIENGIGTSIDLAPLQDGTGTDDQNIQNLSFNSTTNLLTVGIENGTSQSVSLSSLAGNDVDWYEQGTTNAPNAISDDIYTEGDVDINNGVLSISSPTNSSGGLTVTKTISNAGSLTYSSVNNNVSLTGSNNSIMYNNSYTGGGTGGQTLIQNGFFTTGASFLTGMINNFNNNNNTTQSYGIQNNFNITSFGSRVGFENNFSTVNGNATGLNNIITGGIGTLYGTRTQITGGTGTNYGNVVSMTGGTATRYGFLADITGTGAGIEYGIRTNVEDVTNGYAKILSRANITGTRNNKSLFNARN
ncbi:hypothetical protein H9X57_09060 [Flavobacterium piscinae]|nr:hypothetical protein [Flavobacterium piscinae]